MPVLTRPLRLILCVAALLAALAAAPFTATAAPPLPGNVDPTLLKAALQDKTGSLRFVVELRAQADLLSLQVAASSSPGGQAARQARTAAVVSALRRTAADSQAPLLVELEAGRTAGRVRSYESLWIVNAVAVEADRDTLLAVAARPEVRFVRLDRWRQWVTDVPGDDATASDVGWNIAKVRADVVWGALGIDGTGVVVANVDTGVDWLHPALAASYRGYHAGLPAVHTGNWHDASDSGYLYPADAMGHGTHTMGTMAGAGGIGVAPGARWIAVKAFNNTGAGYDSWLHAAYQWILAPDGDPALSPDVVNNSWGNDNAAITTFSADTDALTAAGIVSMFSAGNNGPGAGSVTSPASLPGVFSVGAVDSSDLVALFSSRGPSPWSDVKPSLVAPGVGVPSSTPGGAYQNWDGTSMAAPHASGTAALLLQAAPGLSVTRTLYALTSTAVPLKYADTDPVPNNTYGWGRLDALGAVLSVASTGSLSGTVRAQGGLPIAGAAVTAWSETGGLHATGQAGGVGRYAVPLAAGPYTVTASAFGYTASLPAHAVVITGQVTALDLTLAPVPTGTLRGFVTAAGTGAPVSATVDVTPPAIPVATDPTTGAYTVTLPQGDYDLRVSARGYRLDHRAGVTVPPGGEAVADFALDPGPSVLVVDSGAWYNDPHGARYDSDLEALDYYHDMRPIRDPGALPSLGELRLYDAVVWSAPRDSPGLIRAEGVLSAYLQTGGRLLVTGQDVAFWDGGGSGTFASTFLGRFLHARYVGETGPGDVHGLAGSPIAGITVTLNTPDSDANQATPDVVDPLDDHAAALAAYGSGALGGVDAEICLPYRTLFLSFGLEGAGPQANRRAVLDRAIGWLMSGRPADAVSLTPPPLGLTGRAGDVVTTSLRLWNTGLATDTYAVATPAASWPVGLWDGAFVQPLAPAVTVPSCQAITVGVAVTIPYDTPRATAVTTTVQVRSISDGTVSATQGVRSATAAPLLLVDDDRWYDEQPAYRVALDALGWSYDVWDTTARPRAVPSNPDAGALSLYPAVVWFTAYDWFQPLTTADESALTAYLNGGGRLLLSSQDYLYVSRLTPFGAGYLGVLTYTNDITAETETGVAGSPIADGLGPYTPTVDYHMWPDIVTPTTKALTAFVNPRGAATSLTLDGGGFRTAFLTFPLEGLPLDGRAEVLRRTLTWFGPARASTFAVDRAAASGGDLAYALTLENPSAVTVTMWITNLLPAALSLDPASVQGAALDPTGALKWSGEVPPRGRHAITYRAELDDRFRGWVVNQATVAAGGEEFTLTARTVAPTSLYVPMVWRHWPPPGSQGSRP